MTKQLRAAASTTMTHDGNDLNLKVEQGDAGLDNSQEPMGLIDPASVESGFTHSDEKPTMPGMKTKASTTAGAKPKVEANGAPAQSLKDEELPQGGKIAEMDNSEDPAAGYLNKEAGMPVIDNTTVAGIDDDAPAPGSEVDDDAMPGDDLEATTDDNGAGEFDDLPGIEASDDDGDDDAEFEDLEPEAPMPEASSAMEPSASPVEETAEFEAATPSDEEQPLVDVDEVPDNEGSDELVFAAMGNAVHVIRSNRIIASMGPASARKLGIGDVFQSEQYQAVVANAINTKGLRKGLVQQGFVLAKVKMTASKATSKIVSAKVEAGMKAKTEAIAKQNKAMEQSLAIAAVGMNKHYWKDVPNVLKANMITELEQAGVRGAKRLVAAVFATHGVSYAKQILALAQRIAAMPEEVRDNHAESLDMTSDGDFDDDDMVESGAECMDGEAPMTNEFEEFDEVPASVTAALANPMHRRTSSTKMIAGVKDMQGVNSFLYGGRSLIG